MGKKEVKLLIRSSWGDTSLGESSPTKFSVHSNPNFGSEGQKIPYQYK